MYCLFCVGYGDAPVVRWLGEGWCLQAVGARIGCTRLYCLLACVGNVLRERCGDSYVYAVMGSLGGRGLRPGNGGRGGCFWSVCVWGGVGLWALCLGIWL